MALSMTCTDTPTTLWQGPFPFQGRLSNFQDSLTLFGENMTDWTEETITVPFTSTIAYYNPCSPWLSVPSRLLNLDTKWSTCVRNFRGLHDPPTILNTENGFSIPPTTAADRSSPMKTNSPAAGQEIQLPTPTPTSSAGDNTLRAQPSPIVSLLPAVATFKGAAYTMNSASAFVVAGQTLSPGGAITVANTVLSMASDGRSLLIGGTSTQILDPAYAVGTQVVSAGGPAVTVSGTVISVQPGGSSVVLGGSSTEDISVWLGGGASTTATRSGGSNAPLAHEAASVGTSRNLESTYWRSCQVVLSAVIGISVLL